MALRLATVVHAPPLATWETPDGIHLALDPEGPAWIASDARGARILALVDGRRTVAEIAAADRAAEPERAIEHALHFLRAAERAGIVAGAPFSRAPYTGREARLGEPRLREMWIHLNDACNLSCAHCLVSSGPGLDRGLTTERILATIDEAAALGAERFFFTGGEPFLRRDLAALAARVTRAHDRDLVILTNATILDGRAAREALDGMDRAKVAFQVSIDGATAAENDPLRGEGTFAKASAGLALLAELGFQTALTVVPCRSNLAGLPALPALAKTLGAGSVHLMWAHRRGRGLAMLDAFPRPDELLPVVRAVREAARAEGVRLDNVESLALRVNAVPGVKHDLGMMGVEALCLSTDGALYPSAATAGHADLRLGSTSGGEGASLREVWLGSEITARLRAATLADMPEVAGDPLRFLTGGGDLEHAWFWSGSLTGADPYAPLVTELTRDLMAELGRAGRARLNQRAGLDAPMIFHAMGEGALACGDEVPGAVRTLHSNCVLSFDVDRPRALVRAYYGAAATTPKADLCCPVRPSEEDLRHIPKDVVDRFYGCGSPVADAALRFGESHLDLGSGAGIDVFIAARHVGPMGKTIGVDMTPAMLAVARENKPIVARNLGYDVVSFREGVLEKVPVADRTIDCVTSNCVVNLSPDKRAVLAEVWRVLRDHGRLVLADIVAERAVPPHLRVNPELWGECLSGALTEDELLDELRRAGFFGIEILKRAFWREVEGHRFSSLTVRAWKREPPAEPARRGHVARYDGPFAAVTDERGRVFRRNDPVEVSEDEAVMLLKEPYAGSFTVEGPALPVPITAKKKHTGPPGCC